MEEFLKKAQNTLEKANTSLIINWAILNPEVIRNYTANHHFGPMWIPSNQTSCAFVTRSASGWLVATLRSVLLFPSQHCRISLSRYHSEPVTRTVAAEAEG
jgi:hypothetical protein